MYNELLLYFPVTCNIVKNETPLQMINLNNLNELVENQLSKCPLCGGQNIKLERRTGIWFD